MKPPIIDVTSSTIDPSRLRSRKGVSIAAMPPPEPPSAAGVDDALLD